MRCFADAVGLVRCEHGAGQVQAENTIGWQQLQAELRAHRIMQCCRGADLQSLGSRSMHHFSGDVWDALHAERSHEPCWTYCWDRPRV